MAIYMFLTFLAGFWLGRLKPMLVRLELSEVGPFTNAVQILLGSVISFSLTKMVSKHTKNFCIDNSDIAKWISTAHM